MSFQVPNKFRLRNHPTIASDDSYGNNGAFSIPVKFGVIAWIVASDGEGWEHVSVHIMEKGRERTPSWDEMCEVKNLFWDEEDCVIQYHPAKSEYVNRHKHTLHLWRPIGIVIPIPNKIMVG